MSNETPAEVLALFPEISQALAILRRDDEHGLYDLLCNLRARLSRALAAGKVAPAAWRIKVGASNVWGYCEHEWQADFHGKAAGIKFIKEPLYTAPPADPANPLRIERVLHLLMAGGLIDSTNVDKIREIIADCDLAKTSEPEEVRIDFPGIGHAGPFAVANGEITLPAATMSDLAHHFRMGYVVKASGSAPEDEGPEGEDGPWAPGWDERSRPAPEPFTDGRLQSLIDHHETWIASAKESGFADAVTFHTDCLAVIRNLATPPASAPEVTEEMVFRLAYWMAKNDGHEDPDHLIWEGNPPEPWGEVWNRYEEPARAALTAALQQEGKSHDQ